MSTSVAVLAAAFCSDIERQSIGDLLIVLDGEPRAEALARLLGQMEPGRVSLHLPAWDCLPFDRASPSADIMGHRMRVLHRLATRREGALTLVTTAEALVQRLPPAASVPHPWIVKNGSKLAPDAVGTWCASHGYRHADRVEDVGQIAVRGEVIDVFPPTSRPYRITVLDGIVDSIHGFDPVGQRSTVAVSTLRLDPVTEVFAAPGTPDLFVGMEHWLPLFHTVTATLVDYLPLACVASEPSASVRLSALFRSIPEAHRDRVTADRTDPLAPRKAMAPERLYLTASAWQGLSDGRLIAFPDDATHRPVPRFCLDDKPAQALGSFIGEARADGQRIVLSAAREHDLALLAKEATRITGRSSSRLERWREALDLTPGSVALMRLCADHGFHDAEAGITLVTAADVLGHHARASSYHAVPMPWHVGDGEFSLGDHIVHLDHGVGVLSGLETMEQGAAAGREMLRILYAKGTELLTPVEEFDRVWRYGTAQDGMALDKLDTDGWGLRRVKIARAMDETARDLVALARTRDATPAPKLATPRRDYERFVAGFPYAPTPDQIHAIDDCLRDLARGRPMDRLVVGDVGFGKTEVALRAAAAAVLAGCQVAVVVPTTVLARQHAQGFAARFAAFGIEVALLSRTVSAAEARRVREGLADGSIRLVVGTHALAGRDVVFDNLGLLVVDEEQRFGTADKHRLRERGQGVHVLTLSATPIPRTLQSALVGLQELSLIATPPARRLPIHTLVAPFDPATIRTALLREKERGGQSFVVTPRIEDIAALETRLAALVPELSVSVGHGGLGAQVVDEALMRFSGGEGDVLLATSIIESGLDVPRANTMIVCGAERFGLAQLHQLRGRVGRGRRQGICYLMTDADHAMSEATAHRLATLARLDRLGSGMAISAQDLDSRGAGDLTGEEQAGHVKLIGLGLYQHLLQLAIREARGEQVEEWTPAIHGGEVASIPAGYIPEADVRLNLYARIARCAEPSAVEDLAAEVADRFGPPPDAVHACLRRARLRSLCHARGVERVDIGPMAIALTPRSGVDPAKLAAMVSRTGGAAPGIRNGRVIDPRGKGWSEQRHIDDLIDRLSQHRHADLRAAHPALAERVSA